MVNKNIRKPGTTLSPLPVVMVSSAAEGYRQNIITLAWAGTVCSDPPMVSISIRPGRYSHEIISKSKEFVINVPNKELLKATDYCGVTSGREVNKFEFLSLTPEAGKEVKAPLIAEAPLNIECKVKEIIPLGSHDLFLGEVAQVHINSTATTSKSVFDLEKSQAIVYGNGVYYQVGEYLDVYGHSQR